MKSLMSTLLACALIFGINGVSAQQRQRVEMTPQQRSEKMAENMTERLDLSADQQKKVYDLHYSITKDITAGRGREGMAKTREAFSEGMRNILTDEQLTKWQESRNQNMRPDGERRGNREARTVQSRRDQNCKGECICNNDDKKTTSTEQPNTPRSERRARRSAQNS